MSSPSQDTAPRKRDASVTRAKLLQTAERLFVEKGFDGTRIDEIAEQSGINKRMLYVYFGNKEQVYAEVLRLAVERVLALGQAQTSGSDDPASQVANIIRRYFRFVAEHPEFVRLLGWESLGQRSGQLMARLLSAGLEDMRAVLARGVKLGVFRPDLDVHKIVLSVSALVVGYHSRRGLLEALWNRDFDHPAVQEELAEHIVSLVLHGIVPSSGRRPHSERGRSGLHSVAKSKGDRRS